MHSGQRLDSWKKYTPLFRGTKGSRKCCSHGRTDRSGTRHTRQTAWPSEYPAIPRQHGAANNRPRLRSRVQRINFESRQIVPGRHVIIPVQIVDQRQCKRRVAGALQGYKRPSGSHEDRKLSQMIEAFDSMVEKTKDGFVDCCGVVQIENQLPPVGLYCSSSG